MPLFNQGMPVAGETNTEASFSCGCRISKPDTSQLPHKETKRRWTTLYFSAPLVHPERTHSHNLPFAPRSSCCSVGDDLPGLGNEARDADSLKGSHQGRFLGSIPCLTPYRTSEGLGLRGAAGGGGTPRGRQQLGDAPRQV